MINTLAPGLIVGQIVGQIIDPKPPKVGNNAQGAWKLQFAKFRDATGEVDFKAWSHDDLVNGATYSLAPNTQGTGLMLNQTDRGRQIEAKASAVILIQQGQPQYQQPTPAAPIQQAPANPNYTPSPGYVPQQAPSRPAASTELRSAADLLILAHVLMRSHVRVSVEELTGETLTDAEIQAGVASMFISAEKRGGTADATEVLKGLVAKRRAKPAPTPAPKADPYDQTPKVETVDQTPPPGASEFGDVPDVDDDGVPF